MYTERVKFIDFNGQERDETLNFNLTKAELIKLEATTPGGYAAYMQHIIDTKDPKALWDAIEQIITMSYGVKSADGRRFIKNQEVLDNFIQTEAYSELIMKYLGDTDAFVKMVTGIVPKDLANQVADAQKTAANKDAEITAAAN